LSFNHQSGLISISKFTKKYSISTSKVISHLIERNKLVQENTILRSNDHFIHNTLNNNKSVLKVHEKDLVDYLSRDWDKLILRDEEKFIINDINDKDKLIEKLTEASKKKLLFLDFEFKDGNFYEAGFVLYIDGKVVDKQYFFVNDINSIKKQNKLKKQNFKFEILNRNNARQTLLEVIDQADYIVAHNSYCERSILMKNGIFLKKNKFICTSIVFKKLNQLTLDTSLSRALTFYGKKFDSNLPHFAFYDTKMTKILFDSYISI